MENEAVKLNLRVSWVKRTRRTQAINRRHHFQVCGDTIEGVCYFGSIVTFSSKLIDRLLEVATAMQIFDRIWHKSESLYSILLYVPCVYRTVKAGVISHVL